MYGIIEHGDGIRGHPKSENDWADGAGFPHGPNSGHGPAPMEGIVMELVAYCGLYCELCAERPCIPHQADLLLEAMAEEGWGLNASRSCRLGPEIIPQWLADDPRAIVANH